MALIKTSSKISHPITHSIEKTSKSVNGTSFYGGYIYATGNEIAKICGEPNILYDDKVTYEWELEVDGIPFTIYDYREISSPNMSTRLYYHVGAFNKDATKKILEAFKKYGFKTTTFDELIGRNN